MSKEFKHMFAICAYGESPFLEDAIKSLLAQTKKSDIILSTATPNRFISSICEKYSIPVFVTNSRPGIGPDWNFAMKSAESDFVTLCHQDDIVNEKYVESVLSAINSDTIIAFTDYCELRNNVQTDWDTLLFVKRLMLFPFLIPFFKKFIFVRRFILSFGCPICCPSVCFNKNKLKDMEFDNSFKCNLDWDYWERASKLKGDFVYIPKRLLVHRIHEGSETTKLIANNIRGNEDLMMFERFWNKNMSNFLYLLYAKSQKSNKIESENEKKRV